MRTNGWDDGREAISAVYRETLALAVRLDRTVSPDAGRNARRRIAAAIRAELAAIRADLEPQPQPTTTTRGEAAPRDPYARR
jgi:hypothetical protein